MFETFRGFSVVFVLVFRIRPVFYTDPDPDFKTPDLDPPIFFFN